MSHTCEVRLESVSPLISHVMGLAWYGPSLPHGLVSPIIFCRSTSHGMVPYSTCTMVDCTLLSLQSGALSTARRSRHNGSHINHISTVLGAICIVAATGKRTPSYITRLVQCNTNSLSMSHLVCEGAIFEILSTEFLSLKVQIGKYKCDRCERFAEESWLAYWRSGRYYCIVVTYIQ